MINLKGLLTGMLMVGAISVHCQDLQHDYRQMAEEGKYWGTQVGKIMENYFESRIEGDTLINGIVWKKVYNSKWGTGYNSYYAAIRDDENKVYAIAKGSLHPRLLYDFGLKVGSIIRCGMEGKDFCCLLEADEQPDTLLGFPIKPYLRVEHIDTIKWHEQYFRCFTLTLLDSYKEPIRDDEGYGIFNNVLWVEGIGSGSGLFSSWMPLQPIHAFGISCFLNRIRLFSFSDYRMNRNTESIVSTRITVDDVNHGTYNLQGRSVTAPPPLASTSSRGASGW